MNLRLDLLWILLIPTYTAYEIVLSSFDIVTPDSGDRDLVSDPISIHQDCENVRDFGFDPLLERELIFEVQSCADSFILLTESADLSTNSIFEIAIGGWSNNKILINHPGGPQEPYGSGPILDCNNYELFWLKWMANGSISFGNGNIAGFNQLFVKHTGKTVAGLGLRSGFGNVATWKHSNTICSIGTYGSTCDLSCGQCTSVVCNRTDGACLIGCEPGWQGWQCSEAVTTTQIEVTSLPDATTTQSTITTHTTMSDMNITSVQDTTTLNNDFTTSIAQTSATSCVCPCTSVTESPTNHVTDEVDPAPYKVDKESLSSQKRKLTSASDPRKSSMYIGTLGVALIVSIVLLIVVIDCLPGPKAKN